MSSRVYLLLTIFVVVVGVASAEIFGDFLKWDVMNAFFDSDYYNNKEEALQREDEDSSAQNTCSCERMICDCCVDFNVSSTVDFGGPGCVSMKYISKQEGIMLNVSYGQNVLHSQKITKQNKKGTCMPLLVYVAEICAKFSDLEDTEDGLTGCLNFEPTVFGEATTQYPVGCFRMNSDGMFMTGSEEKSSEESDKDDEEEDEDEETQVKPTDEESSFIDVVNQTAQEGLEFISSLLGFDVNEKKTSKNSTVSASTTAATTTATTKEDARKKSKKIKPNKVI